MDLDRLLQKRECYRQALPSIPVLTLQSYELAFEVEYTHNSNAIEGNTLTLMETKLVLEDAISPGGKSLREIYEAVNHQKAYRYVKACIARNEPLSEKIVKDIHAILMENILVGGVYRNVDVYISGAQHTPPSPNEMYRQVKDFYAGRVCPHPSLPGRQWPHLPPADELSAAGAGLCARLHCQRGPARLLQRSGGLRRRRRPDSLHRDGGRPGRKTARPLYRHGRAGRIKTNKTVCTPLKRAVHTVLLIYSRLFFYKPKSRAARKSCPTGSLAALIARVGFPSEPSV